MRGDDISTQAREPDPSPVWKPGWSRLVLGLALAFAGPVLVAIGFLPFRDGVSGATVRMVMLNPTTVAAAVEGPLAAVAAVTVGSVLHNALFTTPYFTLRMSEPSDVLNLIAPTCWLARSRRS